MSGLLFHFSAARRAKAREMRAKRRQLDSLGKRFSCGGGRVWIIRFVGRALGGGYKPVRTCWRECKVRGIGEALEGRVSRCYTFGGGYAGVDQPEVELRLLTLNLAGQELELVEV